MANNPKTNDNRVRVALEKTDLPKKTLFSHDWTDKTTWTTSAVRVVDEIATNSGNNQLYTLAHQSVIDTYHGKINQEDYLKDSSNNSYRATIKVNNTVKTEQDPHLGSGGDYTINYASGEVNFLSALNVNDEVKVTYHYATDSKFVLKPDAGKILRIEFVEVQFSTDVELTDTVKFQPYGFVEVFAPQYCTTNDGPYPPGTKIPLGEPAVYKTITDYQNEAVKAYTKYQSIGGSGWRGAQGHEIVVLDWDYVSSTPLRSDYGMEIHLELEHNIPFGGWYATATFYCVTEDL